jgi:hypothetical protein
MADIGLARESINRHARLLDRRRLDLLFDDGDPEAVFTAPAGYADRDGGFGWTLHPDLRSQTSQPVAAFNSFEIFEEVDAAPSLMATALCDWLDRVSLPDGGLPFALPHRDEVGSTPMCVNGRMGMPA